MAVFFSIFFFVFAMLVARATQLTQLRTFKILALHGKGNSGDQFRKSLKPLLDATPNCDWHFINGPHKLDRGFCWWNLPPGARSYTALKYDGLEQSLDTLDAAWATDGPFDIVFGHSQGAMLAAISVALASSDRDEIIFRPKSGIFSGSAWPNAANDLLTSVNSSLPTLHIWGTQDDVNPWEMAMKLKDNFGCKADSLVHSGGHIVPLDEASIQKIRSFVLSTQGAEL
jgi:predicted esterase